MALEHSSALNILIDIYHEENNIERAIQLLDVAKKIEKTTILNKLGNFYRDGIVFKQDY